MAKTKLEISTRVLKKLGRLPAGQVAKQYQIQTVNDAYDGLYQELLNNALVDWTSTDDIPEYAVDPITIMLSGRVADDFGVPDKWSQFEGDMKRILSQQLALPYTSQPTTFVSY